MSVEYLVKPWQHQLDAIDRARSAQDFALLFDMGTGKTATTINILRHKFQEHKKVLRTLIVCPVVVCENWRREFEMHSKVSAFVHVLAGSGKKRLKEFETLKEQKRIFITNYESLQMDPLLQAILKWGPEASVWDESQRLKNPTAVRTKRAILIADRTLHNYILSGTPILNNPMDVWGQYRVLDRGASFPDHMGRPMSFMHFRAKYFMDLNAGMPSASHFPKWVIVPGMEEVFQKIIYTKAMRVLKSECLDLPPFIRKRVDVEMSPEQWRLYEEMKANFVAYLESGDAVTAQVAVTKALRLQQIVSGYCKTEEGEEINLKDNPRMSALKDLLEEIPPGEKVIVWSTFQANYRQIAKVCESLGYEYRELHGGVSGKQRQEQIDSFNQDPKVKVMIANQAAGGVGVNLIAASYAICYSRNFSLEQDLQAKARNYRGGSEIHEKITWIDLVASDTIDELILEALENKLDLSEKILDLKNKLANGPRPK